MSNALARGHIRLSATSVVVMDTVAESASPAPFDRLPIELHEAILSKLPTMYWPLVMFVNAAWYQIVRVFIARKSILEKRERVILYRPILLDQADILCDLRELDAADQNVNEVGYHEFVTNRKLGVYRKRVEDYIAAVLIHAGLMQDRQCRPLVGDMLIVRHVARARAGIAHKAAHQVCEVSADFQKKYKNVFMHDPDILCFPESSIQELFSTFDSSSLSTFKRFGAYYTLELLYTHGIGMYMWLLREEQRDAPGLRSLFDFDDDKRWLKVLHPELAEVYLSEWLHYKRSQNDPLYDPRSAPGFNSISWGHIVTDLITARVVHDERDTRSGLYRRVCESGNVDLLEAAFRVMGVYRYQWAMFDNLAPVFYCSSVPNAERMLSCLYDKIYAGVGSNMVDTPVTWLHNTDTIYRRDACVVFAFCHERHMFEITDGVRDRAIALGAACIQMYITACDTRHLTP